MNPKNYNVLCTHHCNYVWKSKNIMYEDYWKHLRSWQGNNINAKNKPIKVLINKHTIISLLLLLMKLILLIIFYDYLWQNRRGGRVGNTNELLRSGLSLATIQKGFYYCSYSRNTITVRRGRSGGREDRWDGRSEVNWWLVKRKPKITIKRNTLTCDLKGLSMINTAADLIFICRH